MSGVAADAFEAEANGEIGGSGDRMVRADFSFQILDGFDVRLGDQIIRQENFEAHHHTDIGAAHFSTGDCRSGAGDDMKLAGKQRHERLGRAFDVNDIDVEIMLFENAGIFGDPKHRRRAGVGRNVGEVEFVLGQRGPPMGCH